VRRGRRFFSKGPVRSYPSFEKRSSTCRLAPSRSLYPIEGSASSRLRMGGSTSSTGPGLDSSVNFDSLAGGERVSFEIEPSQKGPRANRIKLA